MRSKRYIHHDSPGTSRIWLLQFGQFWKTAATANMQICPSKNLAFLPIKIEFLKMVQWITGLVCFEQNPSLRFSIFTFIFPKLPTQNSRFLCQHILELEYLIIY